MDKIIHDVVVTDFSGRAESLLWVRIRTLLTILGGGILLITAPIWIPLGFYAALFYHVGMYIANPPYRGELDRYPFFIAICCELEPWENALIIGLCIILHGILAITALIILKIITGTVIIGIVTIFIIISLVFIAGCVPERIWKEM